MEKSTSSPPPDVSPSRTQRQGAKRRFSSSDIAVGAVLGMILLGMLTFITLKGNKPGNAPAADSGAPLAMEVFLHPHSSPTESRQVADQDTVQKTDGFTFTLHNRTQFTTHVMIFGMDSADTMYWFFPRADPQKRAASLPMGPAPTAVLPEGVTPGNVPSGIFRFVSLFANEPITIQEVEDAYRQAGPNGMAAALQATMQVVSVKVE